MVLFTHDNRRSGGVEVSRLTDKHYGHALNNTTPKYRNVEFTVIHTTLPDIYRDPVWLVASAWAYSGGESPTIAKRKSRSKHKAKQQTTVTSSMERFNLKITESDTKCKMLASAFQLDSSFLIIVPISGFQARTVKEACGLVCLSSHKNKKANNNKRRKL